MMKSPHLRERDDAPKISRLDTPRFGSILRKDGMGPCTIVVAGVLRDDSADLPLIESDQVIQALAAQGPNEPLRIAILPRGARGNRGPLQGPFLSASRGPRAD